MSQGLCRTVSPSLYVLRFMFYVGLLIVTVSQLSRAEESTSDFLVHLTHWSSVAPVSLVQ